MEDIQAVNIYLNNDIIIIAEIFVPNGSTTTAEAVIKRPFCWNRHCNSAISAFEAIINKTNQYIAKSGGSIFRINNPCNTQFVSREQQQKIISSKSIDIKIEVNA